MYVHKQDYKGSSGKKSFGKSRTIPDQTMSLRTILDRHSRGLPITGNKLKAEYFGEEVYGVDLKHMDLADREDYILAKKQELEVLKQKIADDQLRLAAKKKAIEEAQRKKPDEKPQEPIVEGNSESTNNT